MNNFQSPSPQLPKPRKTLASAWIEKTLNGMHEIVRGGLSGWTGCGNGRSSFAQHMAHKAALTPASFGIAGKGQMVLKKVRKTFLRRESVKTSCDSPVQPISLPATLNAGTKGLQSLRLREPSSQQSQSFSTLRALDRYFRFLQEKIQY